jgi:hypothetical protein
MVDVFKLKSRMALAGYNQKTLVAELNARGLKISENTLSAKMKGRSQFYVEDAVTICEILGIEKPSDKADIFLA